MKWILFIAIAFSTYFSSAQAMEDLVLEAGNLFIKGDYKKAIPAAEKAAIALKEILGEDNVFYIGLLTIQASSYKFTQQFEQSEKIYLQLKEKILKVSGENDESYTSLLNNIGGLYEKMGQYQKAESYFLQGMEIRKRIAGEFDEGFATCMNGLGAVYHGMGLYAKAEPLYTRVNEIRKKIYGEEHSNYAISLNNLATLYTETGQYDKAEALYLRASAIQKNLLGSNHPDYALAQNNLANLWQQLKQYKKAESAYIESAEIRKNTLGATHPDYAASLNNIATLYADQGLFKQAEPYLHSAVEIWKKALGVNSMAYATGLNNLAAFYRKTGTKYSEAEAFYLEALRLRKLILGPSHPYYAETENDLGLLYMQMKEFKKAEPFFLSSSATLMKNISSTFTILSEKEKANFLDYNRSLIECNNSFLYSYPKAPATILQNNYDLELGYKSYSLADTRNMLELVRNSEDSSLKKTFDAWTDLKKTLARQYSLPEENRMKDLKQKVSEAEVLEKELNRRSASFNNNQKALKITFTEVRDHLASNEAAIEFVKFRLYNKKQTDSVIYAAYLLRKQDPAPVFIVLCEEKQIKQVFEQAGSTPNRMVRTLYRGQEAEAAGPEGKQGMALYKLIWQPLEPYLKGITRVSYSPAGLLYGVAFHALPVSATSILMDKYQLQQYTSTRQIALRNEEEESARPGAIVLFGNALFTMDSMQLAKQRSANEVANESGYLTTNRGTGLGTWMSLPGTAEEVNAVGRLFEENKISNQTYVGESASEDRLKSLGPKSPQILHLATHGFFLPEVDRERAGSLLGNVYSLANDPLLRSGLVLAGGNYVWSGNRPVDGIEDGIATAYEISQLNLSNTALLVLSACETALGDIKGSEGVFGLQRGFKMAGTKKMIVSLWQVPDKETAELMTRFYSIWMSGKKISESFYLAQAELRKKYPAYYWAAFILVE